MAQNSNDQTVTGTENDDHIVTGSGDDSVVAGAGDDKVEAGAGDDTVLGGSGEDTLIGDTPAAATFFPEPLAIASDYSATVTFEGESAGYKNSIGAYKVDPATGKILDVQMIWGNASASGDGGSLIPGESSVSLSVEAGEQIGFFVIANGGNENDFNDFQGGEFQFVDTGGNKATVDESAPPVLQHVADDGTVSTLDGSIFHSVAGGAPTLNPDGQVHVTAQASDTGSLTLGFEDMLGGGDQDFNDLMITLDVGAANLASILHGHGVEGGADATTGNLIENGSFESVEGMSEVDWGHLGNLKGWTVEGDWAETVSNGATQIEASDGEKWLDMASSPGDIAISQTVHGLQSGDTYTLTLDAAERNLGANASVKVFWNGGEIGVVDPNSTDMAHFSFDIVGGSGDGSNTLKFVGVSEDANEGVSLDNVQLYAANSGGDDRLEGRTGEDEILGHGGDDLLVGGGAGTEWELVDGKWVYHPDRVDPDKVDPHMVEDGSDDVIVGGAGEDVLLGNAGNDTLYAGSGKDRINAGKGDDVAFGGADKDIINLEKGDDYAEGGSGADIINAGSGNDVVYGDNAIDSLLRSGDEGFASFAQYGETDAWTNGSDPDSGMPFMTHSVDTEAGQTYTLSFDLAANLPAGATSGTVEVLWDGQVIDTITTHSGAFDTHTFTIDGTGGVADLTFRNITDGDQVAEPSGPEINTDGPIFSYEKSVEIQGEAVDVSAFAPGQAKLYQVISGQLKVFDAETSEYVDAGDPTGISVNAIGFNVEDDLIYGIAKSNGTDAAGNAVSKKDLVMMDAEGNAYRIGETPIADFVGDFDGEGNLWTFDSSLNRITKIDVDNLDSDGNPEVVNSYLPKDLFKGKTYDIAYNEQEQCFYAVEPPSKNGGDGQLHRIDVSEFDGTNSPEITSIPINATLFEGTMQSGMAKGAFGAVFMDGEGNLYAGLNSGDHDLDSSTAGAGAIYKINYDFEGGAAHAEFMAEAEKTGANDGAVDPRSIDPFAEVDTTSTIQIRSPELILDSGGDDKLRGGSGDDEMYGNAGDDVLQGGSGDDTLSGDQGNDKVFGGSGDDDMSGGLGKDHLSGGGGADTMSGDEGKDFLKGGDGDDAIDGGADDDKLHGGEGDDSLLGGAGNDKIWGNAGEDFADGGLGNDTINLGADNDRGFGGAGEDFILGRKGDDVIDGGAGNDKVIGGTGSDTISGGAGDDHLWGGEWEGDGETDTFYYSHRGGKDLIHDFETEFDQIDLSAYGLSFEDIQDRMVDHGWATEINLEGIDKSGAGDKIMIKSVKPDDLDESNFIV